MKINCICCIGELSIYIYIYAYVYICIYTNIIYNVSVLFFAVEVKNLGSSRGALSPAGFIFSPLGIF